jgi:hypothetical protein
MVVGPQIRTPVVLASMVTSSISLPGLWACTPTDPEPADDTDESVRVDPSSSAAVALS